VSLAPRDATRLQECLAGDGLAVIPTDTVYGLACNPQSVTAVKRMHDLKGRPTTKPSAVMFFAPAPALDALTNLGPRTRAAFKTLLPGPVTLLLPGPAGGTLGVRVPRLQRRLAALTAVRSPALQSSANLSGEPAPRRLSDVPLKLREGADLVLDGGELPGTASTVIDLTEYEQTGAWRIVREGPIAASAVRSLLE